jgi:Multiubiquitin
MSNSNNEHAPGQNKTVNIVVNGRPREVSGKRITYNEVVQLAFPNEQPNQDIAYTVAYDNPHGKDGTLVDSQDVKLKEDMIFNVTKTNRS